MRLLVVGRLSGQLASAVKMAMAHGAKVNHVERADQATEQLRRGQGADLLMVDYKLDIASLIAANDAERIHVPVVAFGVDADAREAAAAIKAGAKEYIPLPPDADLIAAVLAAVADDEKPMISADPSMKAVLQLADQVARSEASILVTGESGVGKEVIARALHGASDRAGKPFVAVNCGALPANLAESILFGHEKGAFTGAVEKTLGKFREADGGTLFLDEIGELPLDLQVKLLRALQEGEIDPVGGKRPVRIDVRIVSATNRDPAQQVKDGAFREDLFYRLNVFPIEAPSLRDRREDIPALVDHFVARFNVEEGKRVAGCAPETLTMLQGFDWPGNVRQLENAVFRAIVLADAPFLQPHDFPAISGVIAPMPAEAPAFAAPSYADLPPLPDQPIRILDDRGHLRTLEDIERDLIQHAIEVYAGHMSEIARRLGIGRSTLYRKVREQGLEGQLKEAG